MSENNRLTNEKTESKMEKVFKLEKAGRYLWIESIV